MSASDILKQFPDGTPIDDWFTDPSVPAAGKGKEYPVGEYGITDDGTVQTEKLQALIDRVSAEGGGTIVIAGGTCLSGALFFKQGVHLRLEADGVLKGSDDISDYPLCETRIEGESCLYFPALVNADGLDGFSITGEGTIDGNGMRFWRGFWLRRAWNPACTNKDEQRPRLVFVSNCSNVRFEGVTFQNSPFWTTHIYKCRRVKYLGCRMLSPHAPVGGPSTDAIDIDACSDVLIQNCFMAVNDDAVALKGGKGPWADTAPENGSNERIIIEDCEYGFCHGCLTFGSECVHSRNIIMRGIKVSTGYNFLWLKFRPDTPQCYEYVLAENITGKTANFLNINPWTQFYDTKGRTDLPVSRGENITIRNCRFECDTYFNVKADKAHYRLSGIRLENLDITAANLDFDASAADSLAVNNVRLTAKEEIEYPDSVTTI
ncbi:MAG: exopolygalacturonase [Lachnospiraceae bacterium]|nr:exopolygalacturonase [Lachnospiraceae bacterium]